MGKLPFTEILTWAFISVEMQAKLRHEVVFNEQQSCCYTFCPKTSQMWKVKHYKWLWHEWSWFTDTVQTPRGPTDGVCVWLLCVFKLPFFSSSRFRVTLTSSQRQIFLLIQCQSKRIKYASVLLTVAIWCDGVLFYVTTSIWWGMIPVALGRALCWGSSRSSSGWGDWH